MIQVIAGNKGTGKTKKLMDMATEAMKKENGIVVFIDSDNKYMMDLPHEIRFVDASEYTWLEKPSAESLLGFINGMLAGNYDITTICIDAFDKLTKNTALADTEAFFAAIDSLGSKFDCTFVINVNEETSALPPFIARYAI